jgi:ribosomal protein L21
VIETVEAVPVTPGEVVQVERLDRPVGATIEFDRVLAVELTAGSWSVRRSWSARVAAGGRADPAKKSSCSKEASEEPADE